MGIDGIGSKGPTGPSRIEPQGPSRAAEVGRPFAPASAATQSAAPTAVSGPSRALERLQAGEIDRETYLDLKVHEATSHLGVLPPAQIEAIRGALRDRMASDPTLVDLVRRATGGAPDLDSDR